MDDACGLRALLSKRVYMAHDIMAHQFFALFCHIIIDVVHMLLHLVDLFLRDDRLSVLGKSQLHLCLGKCNPQLSPCGELHIL